MCVKIGSNPCAVRACLYRARGGLAAVDDRPAAQKRHREESIFCMKKEYLAPRTEYLGIFKDARVLRTAAARRARFSCAARRPPSCRRRSCRFPLFLKKRETPKKAEHIESPYAGSRDSTPQPPVRSSTERTVASKREATVPSNDATYDRAGSSSR